MRKTLLPNNYFFFSNMSNKIITGGEIIGFLIKNPLILFKNFLYLTVTVSENTNAFPWK